MQAICSRCGKPTVGSSNDEVPAHKQRTLCKRCRCLVKNQQQVVA